MPIRTFFALCLATSLAMAYVPPEFQGIPPQPSVRPVHGPIRPNQESINLSGAARSIPRSHGRIYQYLFPTTSIFWGKEWQDRRFSQDKIQGIDFWYSGYSDSNYAHALDQYFWVGEKLHYEGHLIASDSGLGTGNEDDDISATTKEICGLIDKGELPLAPGQSYYPVYVTRKRAKGGACAINGTDVCATNGNPFSFAIIYNLDRDPGCDPGDHATGHSQGLAALANVSARAVSEQRSDWNFTGYYDENGNEVDDKCAWTFNVSHVTFSNGSIWKLQGLWSNLAFLSGTGYPNAGGEKGCVDGR